MCFLWSIELACGFEVVVLDGRCLDDRVVLEDCKLLLYPLL